VANSKKDDFEGRVKAAAEALTRGRMVIIADDEDRENEGDLVCPAILITPDHINFMSKFGRGLICVTLSRERATELSLEDMVENNTEFHDTAFTVSVDADKKFGLSTGISAHDRAQTVRTLVDPRTKAGDLRKPGHIFPLVARDGGVLRRVGQTEGSVDLARIAGLYPAGVICEILSEDGSMARRDELLKLSKKHELPFLTVKDIVRYRLMTEKLIFRSAESSVPTPYGRFKILTYQTRIDKSVHVALIMGNIRPEQSTLTRVHSECFTGDVLGSLRCDCGDQLSVALKKIAEAGTGVLLYLRQEGRGIGLVNKIRAYQLQDDGDDTVTANEKLGFRSDLRDYGIGAQILRDVGLRKIKLMTNNPRKIVGLDAYGLVIDERVPLFSVAREENKKYLSVKKSKLGHFLP